MKKIFSKKLWIILTSVFVVLFSALLVATYLCTEVFYSAVNMAFQTSTIKRVDDPDAEPSVFYSTDYDFEINGENLFKEDCAIIEEAEAAGSVLFWNKNNALPLKGDEKVSCFGHASVDIRETGTGSGYSQTFDYVANKEVKVTLKDALISRGFTVNNELWNLYESGAAKSYQMTNPKADCTEWMKWYVNEAPWDVVNTVGSSFAAFGDVALVTLARSGGEYSDLHYNYVNTFDTVGDNDRGVAENSSADGGYLGLTDEECEMLGEVTRLRNEGVFKKVVMLLNVANPLQMEDFDAYYDGIDACMWIGQPGSTGINAIVDLLKGKDMKGKELIPSGHITDTWLYNNNSAPASMNDGNYTYGNTELLTGGNLGTTAYVNKYMVYQEGIYIGYRYFETRYTDAVRGQGSASSAAGAVASKAGWKYDEEVAFPFGYGKSYTDFTYGNFSVEKGEDSYLVSVDVTNSGKYSGKEVVQVYLQKPYTEYDKTNGIEKSAVELVGYTKTDILEPTATKTYTVEIPEESFKTYDASNYETYILEGGEDNYYLTVASDAHTAANQILEKEGFTVSENFMGGAGSTAATQGNMVETINFASTDTRTYSVSAQTGYDITNQFNSGDINKYANRGDNSVTYLSRSDWSDTYPTRAAELSLNAEMVNDLRFDNIPDSAGVEMPKYHQGKSTNTDKNGTKIADIKAGDVVAYQFIDAPLNPLTVENDDIIEGKPYGEYWESMWNQLLDQMTLEEQCYMVVNSFHWIHGAVSIALPESKQENGPVGITKRQEAIFSLPNDAVIKEKGWTFVAYPCAGILAASFDNSIAERIGEHKSEDMLYLGYNGIYGPGVNMHRSPFGGRAFEYPSEDPYLAGMIEAYESKGIESKGCLAYAKHFALNDSETNRVNCGVWSNEQATREIYLRPFELVFTVGGASATMNSFTRVGTRWSGGCEAMMTTVLRDEWGYDGIVISDWVTSGSAMSYIDGVLAGTDTFDGNGTAKSLSEYCENNAVLAHAVRTSVRRVIYNVVRTNVMNGTSVSTTYISVTPWWQTTMYALDIVFGVLVFACAAMLVLCFTPLVKKKNQSEL